MTLPLSLISFILPYVSKKLTGSSKQKSRAGARLFCFKLCLISLIHLCNLMIFAYQTRLQTWTLQ